MFGFSIGSLALSIVSKLGLSKLSAKAIGIGLLVVLFAGTNVYSYYKGKSVERADTVAKDLKKEKENNEAKIKIQDEAAVIEVNTLKDRFDKEQAINTKLSEQLSELDKEIPNMKISEWTCENLEEQRELQRKRDEERARILVEAQWRTYCIGSSDARCKEFSN